MQVLSGRLGVALTGLMATAALAVPLAGHADAATSTVLLHTQTSIPQLLTDTPSGVTSMDPAPLGGNPNQRWVRSDTDSGFATYSSVSSIDAGRPRCLTGRGIEGFPLVTAEPCVPGSKKQQWKLGVLGDLKLRLNGLVAAHNPGGTGRGVLMQLSTGQPNQRWHTHPA